MNTEKVIIIAEAGVNHNGDMTLAKQLIDVAADAGADYVKFQTFKAENLASKNAKKADYQTKNMADNQDDNNSNSQLEMLKKLELSREQHFELIEYCNHRKIQFFSTAFDLESLDFLDTLGFELYKIPSGEITNLPYLKKIGSFQKNIIISTGMADLEEIKDALHILIQAGTSKEKITVLHCNTEYPTPFEDVNLNAMQTIKNTFNVKIGYSDHTEGIEIAIAAVALGAIMIEKHFTLDKTMEGPDHKASLEPNELKMMVKSIRNIEKAFGNGVKTPSNSEKKNIEIARKSIHIAKKLPENHILEENDLIMKRPATGISPMKMEEIIGKRLIINKEIDDVLLWKDIE